jgi:hypothetical protein
MVCALQSDIGMKGHADLENFGQAGAEVVVFDTQSVEVTPFPV